MRRNRQLFSQRPPRRTGCLAYPLLLILLICIIVGLNMINNGRISVIKESVTIPVLPEALEKYAILHISDLHGNEFGAEQATIANMLKTAKYNAVCITGDLCDKDGNYDAFLSLIDIFPDSVPVFFITGDEDAPAILNTPSESNEVKADYVLAAEARGAIYLDKPYNIQVGKSAIWFCPESIYGLDIAASRETYLKRKASLTQDDTQYQPGPAAQLRAIDYRLSVLDDIERSLAEIKDGDVQIALTHHPLTENTINTLQQWSSGGDGDFLHDVSLVLAGHYNAGHIRLPLLGALKAPASAGFESPWLPGDRGIVGLSTIRGVTQYISPGLGVSSAFSLPIRLFNTPAVTVITLTSVLKF